jgi:UDPglucose 6-dehydrogenase
MEIAFHVVSNPEFLKEGDAIRDFMRPDRIIVVHAVAAAADQMRELYLPFNRNHDRLIVMDVPSAELTICSKRAAPPISFMNEIANIAERVGADIEQVRKGIGSDSRIGYLHLSRRRLWRIVLPEGCAGLGQDIGFGRLPGRPAQAVEAVNYRQKQKLSQLIAHHYAGDISGKTFAVWGCPSSQTQTTCARPRRSFIADLVRGAKVRCYDPGHDRGTPPALLLWR